MKNNSGNSLRYNTNILTSEKNCSDSSGVGLHAYVKRGDNGSKRGWAEA